MDIPENPGSLNSWRVKYPARSDEEVRLMYVEALTAFNKFAKWRELYPDRTAEEYRRLG